MQLKNLVANSFKLINLRKVNLPIKRVKESGASFRKKKESQGRRAKKEGRTHFEFCKHFFTVLTLFRCTIVISSNERDEVSSFSKSLSHTETEKTVELEQSNQEVIIESISTNKTLIANDKIDDINNVTTWSEVITHYMIVEMVKAGPERYQNKEGPFKPASGVIKEGDKEKELLSFLSKKWFCKTLKNGDKVLRSWLLYANSHSGLYCFCCKLFQSRNDNSQFVSKPFVNFWHLNQCIFNHKNSKIHKQLGFDKWKELVLRLQLHQTINKIHQTILHLQNLMDNEKNK